MILRINWNETHHLYYGIVLMALGYFLSTCFSYSLILYVIGVVLFVDDLYQHRRQVKQPGYNSPIHVLYVELLWRFDFIRSLNRWFDKLMGKK